MPSSSYLDVVGTRRPVRVVVLSTNGEYRRAQEIKGDQDDMVARIWVERKGGSTSMENMAGMAMAMPCLASS
jgi:hypothetical protein